MSHTPSVNTLFYGDNLDILRFPEAAIVGVKIKTGADSNRSALGITYAMRTDELLRQISGKHVTYRRVDQAAFA
ncbi:MAG: hypothetical protein WC068_16625 [Caulobacter sp.]